MRLVRVTAQVAVVLAAAGFGGWVAWQAPSSTTCPSCTGPNVAAMLRLFAVGGVVLVGATWAAVKVVGWVLCSPSERREARALSRWHRERYEAERPMYIQRNKEIPSLYWQAQGHLSKPSEEKNDSDPRSSTRRIAPGGMGGVR